MATTTKQIKAAELILDWTFYPRHQLAAQNVSSIAQALEAGTTIPPVTADKTSLRVVDGFHRVTATLRHAGPDATIKTHLVDYPDEQAMFIDAVRLNATHGQRLTPYDQARCLELAVDLGIPEQDISLALARNPDQIAELRARKTAYDPQGKPIPIKRTLRHLAGTRLTKNQIRANKHAGGMPVRFYADQVANAIRADIVDWSDEETVLALTGLARELAAAPLVSA